MYKDNSQSITKHIDFLLIDLLCIHVSFYVAVMTGRACGLYFSSGAYINTSVVIALIDLVLLIFLETLKDVFKRGYYKEFAATLKHAFLVELLMIFYVFALPNNEGYSKEIIYFVGIYYFILSFLTRAGWKKVLKKTAMNRSTRSLLIVTTENLVYKTVDSIKNNNYAAFRFAGVAVIDRDMTGKSIRDIKVVANIANVANYVCREWVDEVFIDIPKDYPYPVRLEEKFSEMGVVVHTPLKSDTQSARQSRIVEKLGPYTVLTTSMNFATPAQLFLKRTMDIIGGLVGCIITGVLFLFLAPAIYIKSPGPIFFKQERVGKNGKKFKMYKFRSMYLDAEERKAELSQDNIMSDGMMFKAEFDDRIIGCKKTEDGKIKKGIGNFIRDLSLDEFPQFINVLKGDMSLVGTRPPTLDEWEKYELHHRSRLATKPGITGMWQTSGRSNITDFEEVVKLDTQYISEWNIGLDIKILFKTIAVVFKKEGSM